MKDIYPAYPVHLMGLLEAFLRENKTADQVKPFSFSIMAEMAVALSAQLLSSDSTRKTPELRKKDISASAVGLALCSYCKSFLAKNPGRAIGATGAFISPGSPFDVVFRTEMIDLPPGSDDAAIVKKLESLFDGLLKAANSADIDGLYLEWVQGI